MSQVAGCVERAGIYLLSEAEAREIVDGQIETIEGHWDEVCDLADLAEASADGFRRGSSSTPTSLEGYSEQAELRARCG